jgi:hypothetical protein
MSELHPEKLHVTFHQGTIASALSLPRRYTLTHSDATGDLFLSFPRESCVPSLLSARGLRLSRVTVKPVRSGLVEALRGRMGESTRGAEALFESLLSQSFGGS